MDVNTKISSMYENVGYLGMYGNDVLITILLFTITIIIVAHSSYQAVISELRNNWNSNKCNPIIMPFAGIIMPKPGQSNMDTTFENFNYCIQQDVSAIFSIIMVPFEFIIYLTVTLLEGILQAIKALIEFLAWLKAQVSEIFAQLFQKIILFLIPIVEMVVHMQSALGKVNGILITMLFTAMNIYNITISGIINIMNILVNILTILIAVILAMIAFAFMLLPTPAFMAGTSVYITATIIISTIVIPSITLCILMHVMVNNMFHESSPNAPNSPSVKKKK
jgi:hypothetical protein